MMPAIIKAVVKMSVKNNIHNYEVEGDEDDDNKAYLMIMILTS